MDWITPAISLIGGLFGHKKASAPQEDQNLVAYRNQLYQDYNQYKPVMDYLMGQTSAMGANPLESPVFRRNQSLFNNDAALQSQRALNSGVAGLQERGVYSPSTYAGLQSGLAMNQANSINRNTMDLANQAQARQDAIDQSAANTVGGLGNQYSGLAQQGEQYRMGQTQFNANQSQQNMQNWASALAPMFSQMYYPGGNKKASVQQAQTPYSPMPQYTPFQGAALQTPMPHLNLGHY